jgi:transposase
MDVITMTKAQLRIYNLALKVIEGNSSIRDFAFKINKSYRQAQRIIQKIRDKDFKGVLHGNTAKRPYNKTPLELEQEVLQLLKTKYNGFNLTHFRETVLADENLKIGKTYLQQLARKHGLEKHRRRNSRNVHKPRPRHSQEGSLVQFDGSPHIWFGKIPSVLMIAIDDATGKLLGGEFRPGETSLGGLSVIKEVIEEYGIPEAFYFDSAGIYGKVDRDFSSQIARALETVGSKLIIASSPQAKGRVERAFRTLQDRLIAEMRFHGIKTYEDANSFFKHDFIPRFNKRFGVDPIKPQSAYHPNTLEDLDLIFCKKEQRKVKTGNVFSYQGHNWIVDEVFNHNHRLVNINTHLDGSISFDILGRKVRVKKDIRNYRYLKAG